MEEVRSLPFETRNEAGQELRYPCFFSKGERGMRLGRGCGVLALSFTFFKGCLYPDVYVVHS